MKNVFPPLGRHHSNIYFAFYKHPRRYKNAISQHLRFLSLRLTATFSLNSL